MNRNMEPKKCPMPSQDPQVRSGNFDEVALGYTAEMAVGEARRCLHCPKKPCQSGCPVGIDIPAFIEQVAKEDFEAAYAILSESSALPAVCGRVCPQESQCEQKCVRGVKGEPVAIGRLERFVADWHRTHSAQVPAPAPDSGHRAAIIGAGPSGLTAAGELRRRGHQVTVFEALHEAGGVLVYGIPEFRLPKDIVRREIDGLRAQGVDIQTNMVIGRVLTIDELFDMGYEAVYIASGAGLPSFLGIPGEGLSGVYSANEYLTRVNLMKAYLPGSKTPILKSSHVAVIGGGNVAMDAARCARRLGAESVSIIYRRSMAELPARAEEVEHAQEEGIQFLTLTAPLEILGSETGFVSGLRCERMELEELLLALDEGVEFLELLAPIGVKDGVLTCAVMELGAPDESGRRRPVPVPDSQFTLDMDTVILAIGTTPNPLLRSTTPGLESDKRGCLITRDESGLTTREAVWAGGDAVTGAATVILAMGAGKTAAEAIDGYLRSKTK